MYPKVVPTSEGQYMIFVRDLESVISDMES